MKKHVILLIDQSGSMFGRENFIISSVNSILNSYKSKNNIVFVTMAFFREETAVTKDYIPLCLIRPFTTLDYSPFGRSAVYDAFGYITGKVEDDTKAQEESDRPQETFLYILSDLEDNSSVEYREEDIKKIKKWFNNRPNHHIFIVNTLQKEM